MTPVERRLLERLEKGPAGLYSLAHAGRCKPTTVVVAVCHIRKEKGVRIIFDKYSQTYRLERRHANLQDVSRRNNI